MIRAFPLAVVLIMVLVMPFPSAASAHEISPLELVRDTSSRMLVALKDEGAAIAADPAVLDRLVADIVLPYFDFIRMSQWVLGKYYRKASPEQRELFVAEFRNLLVRTYGRFLSDYSDEKVIYLPAAEVKNATSVKVRTQIELSDNSTISVAYSLYSSSNGWKVYDVAFDGVSMVTNYRSSFGRIIRTEGMDSLIV
ncbi:MAG: ABC transporter substrate-binding protein, partial [Gammaproteobacteria bacterium]|nr:ABC transporter substrate-binding protein [Gammaproteobacteria bacterium]